MKVVVNHSKTGECRWSFSPQSWCVQLVWCKSGRCGALWETAVQILHHELSQGTQNTAQQEITHVHDLYSPSPSPPWQGAWDWAYTLFMMHG